jgi:hypothetical protein
MYLQLGRDKHGRDWYLARVQISSYELSLQKGMTDLRVSMNSHRYYGILALSQRKVSFSYGPRSGTNSKDETTKSNDYGKLLLDPNCLCNPMGWNTEEDCPVHGLHDSQPSSQEKSQQASGVSKESGNTTDGDSSPVSPKRTSLRSRVTSPSASRRAPLS